MNSKWFFIGAVVGFVILLFRVRRIATSESGIYAANQGVAGAGAGGGAGAGTGAGTGTASGCGCGTIQPPAPLSAPDYVRAAGNQFGNALNKTPYVEVPTGPFVSGFFN